MIRQQLTLRVRKGLDLGRSLRAFLQARLPAPVQALGGRALAATLTRWPLLANLVGLRSIADAAADAHASSGEPAADVAMARDTTHVTAATPSDAKDAAAASQTPSLHALLAQLERAAQWQERAQAAAQLAPVEAPAALAALLRALRDPSADAAAAVVDALATRAEPAARRALLEVIGNADGYFHALTRVAAIHGVARCVDGEGLQPLLDAVHDLSAEVSIAAIAALASRMPDARSQLIHVLRDDSGYFLPPVRLAAAHVLTQVGALGAGVAEELLQHETDLGVRELLTAATQH